MNKTIGWIIAILVIIGVIWWAANRTPVTPGTAETIRVGAILPLTGPAAALGEPMKNGLELALKDKANITVQYEDSKAAPADGASAYQRLLTVPVNVVVSAYSGVSVPLTKLALQNKVPLVMSIVAADNVTNEYSYRYYAKPSSYATPAFADSISPLKDVTNLAVLYRNDEYGNSVKNVLTEVAKRYNKNILASEAFAMNETDFATVITKIKATKPQALLFIAGTPAEGVGILKKADELKLNTILIEASAILSDPTVQAQAPAISYYTTAFRFSMPDDNLEFKKQYTDVYGAAPNFAAAFGYDIGTLLADCAGKSSGIQQCLSQTTSVSGLTGDISNITNHEINPPMFLMKVN